MLKKLFMIVSIMGFSATNANAKPLYPHFHRVYLRKVRPHNEGIASWYGPGLYGHKTSSGQRLSSRLYTAANKFFPLGSRLRVTNKNNGKSVVVTVNDRGPFTHNRIIDLSRPAARDLDIIKTGTAPVALNLISLPEDANEVASFEPKKKHRYRK